MMKTKSDSQQQVPSQADLSRRSLVKGLALMFGGLLPASSLALAAQGYQGQADTLNRAGHLLSAKQLTLLKRLVDLIIPATDTPSAGALDVHGFIDNQLKHCFDKNSQNLFIAGLDKLERICRQMNGQAFSEVNTDAQVALLVAAEAGGKPCNVDDKAFFYQLKTLTLLGYYTSEVGATEELSYLAIPGGYRGDVPFAQVGKAWSLN